MFAVEFQVCWLSRFSPPLLQLLYLLDICMYNKNATFVNPLYIEVHLPTDTD